jgi:hypothetical protein
MDDGSDYRSLPWSESSRARFPRPQGPLGMRLPAAVTLDRPEADRACLHRRRLEFALGTSAVTPGAQQRVGFRNPRHS